jgi:hypothetical protein
MLAAGCNGLGKDNRSESPGGYDLNRPYAIKLPIELDEISGVAFHPADTSIFAINDERGWLYKITPNTTVDIKKWKFADGGDFEDVVLLDSIFYVLKSNGNIISFKFISTDSLFLNEYSFPQQDGVEFEILYYDHLRKKLTLICKDCETDKKKSLSTFTFDPWSFRFSDSSFSINSKRIAEMMDENKIKFKPSAAGIHPITGELYILSSVNKLLVICDNDGNPKAIHKISSDFKQPEGLCFTPAGNMIVSNEAAEIGVANIMIFRYNKVGSKK